MKATLKWHNHKYFPYEKELALREIEKLVNPKTIQFDDIGINIDGNFKLNDLKRLAYVSSFANSSTECETTQSKLEKSCIVTGSQKRQSTRYSVHGLHEYKGKFNPQIVRGIINLLGLNQEDKILDPFCGSGTTIVESIYSGITSVGTDINPLATLICKSKILSLKTKSSTLKKYYLSIISHYKESDKKLKESEYLDYLKEWFPLDNLVVIEGLRDSINAKGGRYKNIFLVLVSNLLREYSLQEPADLRVRRRKTALPDLPLLDQLDKNVLKFLGNLESSQKITGLVKNKSNVYNYDSRNFKINTLNKFDGAITSPPYATALPYIDTQRLSLVWMRLLNRKQVKALESLMTGSRDIKKYDKDKYSQALETNPFDIDDSVFDFCRSLENSLSETDGFRRQAVPLLMYRYFTDMQNMFSSVKLHLKTNAKFALVVGHNKTTLGGTMIDIDTPFHLMNLATKLGWIHEESIKLQTYHRYDIHSKNAVNEETLLILKNA